MTFHYDFRLYRTRRALLAALGVSDDMFDAVLAFDPPPRIVAPPATKDGTAIETIGIPMFFRHDIFKKNKARGHRTAWEPTWLKRKYKAVARRLESYFRLCLGGYPHDAAFGYRPGRNIRENAAVHAGNRHLLKLDIENFFGSISQQLVEQLFAALGMSEEAASLLSQFVTIGGALPHNPASNPDAALMAAMAAPTTGSNKRLTSALLDPPCCGDFRVGALPN